MGHQGFLARAVPMIHAVQLRYGLMALIEKHQRVVRQVVEQGGGRFARQTPREVPRVVLDSMAVADLLHHLEIEHGALIEPLRFDLLALLFELRAPPRQLLANAVHGGELCLFGHDIVRLGIDR